MYNFLSADYHLGHENIIKYTNRPFKSLKEMNETIIFNHNQRIKKEDIFIHVGDFQFKNSSGGKQGEGLPIKSNEYESQLNGRIIHLCGNHDKNNSNKTNIINLVLQFANKKIFVVHNPAHYNPNYHINFVGHVHQHWKFKRIKDTVLVNVGVDVWNFKPMRLDELINEYDKFIRFEKIKMEK